MQNNGLKSQLNNNSKKDKNIGFTLVELLISILIFSFISIASYTALSSLINVKEVLNDRQTSFSRLQNTIYTIEDDLLHIINRSIINAEGENEPAYLVTNNEENSVFFKFTRYGIPKIGLSGETGLQRIEYRLDEEILSRGGLNVLDQTSRSEAVYTDLLEGVESVVVEQIDAERPNVWTSTWNNINALPIAVRFEITLVNGSNFSMQFPLYN